MASELGQALINATNNPDPNTRQAAEAQLQQAAQQNLGGFIVQLIAELANEGNDQGMRQQAGLYVKNLLTGRSEAVQQEKAQAWLAIDAATKQNIKQGALQALQCTNEVARNTAAQFVAAMGNCSIAPNVQDWPELLQQLTNFVTGGTDETKQATLAAIGYMCEQLDVEAVDQAQTNQILTAIIDGMGSARPEPVKRAACIALQNSIIFCTQNMATENERNVLMQNVCEATQAGEPATRKEAFACIVEIAENYYMYLTQYMQAFFSQTFNAIKSDETNVKLQAMEFWTTVAEQEYELNEIQQIAQEEGRQLDPSEVCHNFIAGAIPHLVPVLTTCMCQQEEDQDSDTWNISTSAATTLEVVSRTIRDDVVDHMMPFVTSNIQSADWRQKEAATIAFGSIMDGPSQEKLQPMVAAAVPLLLQLMNDPNELVRDTTVWTIARMCEFHAMAIPGDQVLSMLSLLAQRMTDVPRVAAHACSAVANLAGAIETADGATSNPLSAHMQNLLQALLGVTVRTDWEEENLRVSAYEAINELISACAPDQQNTLQQLLTEILQRLAASHEINVSTSDGQQEKDGIQSLLCGVVYNIVQQLEGAVVGQANDIMTQLLQIFSSPNAIAHEEAFRACGALAQQMERGFNIYMQHFTPFLYQGLQSIQETSVCSCAVGVVGDLSRALEDDLFQYCNDIVTHLLRALQSPDLNRSVKPPVLSTFGDIALGISARFEPYLQIVMTMLNQAAQTPHHEDEELAEFVNQLREGVMEAYVGIVRGVGETRKDLVVPHAQGMINMLKFIAADEWTDEDVLSAAVGLAGDLADTLGGDVVPLLNDPAIGKLLNDGNQAGGKCAQYAQWAQKVIQSAGR